jgi:hypothetical protein
MLDVSGECGWLALTLRLQQLIQMILQGRWLSDSPFTVLPHIEPYMAPALHAKRKLGTLPNAVNAACRSYSAVAELFMPELDEGQIEQVKQEICIIYLFLLQLLRSL